MRSAIKTRLGIPCSAIHGTLISGIRFTLANLNVAWRAGSTQDSPETGKTYINLRCVAPK